MSEYTKEDISAILHTAELLNKKGSVQKINISEFCKEAGISRKNAYKHKNNIEISESTYQERIAKLEEDKSQIEQKLELAEARASEADLHSNCREFLKQYLRDNKKNPRRRKELINNYNRVAVSHGLEPLNFWE